MKRSAWLAGLLAAGLVLSYGCGGDDGASSGIVGTWIGSDGDGFAYALIFSGDNTYTALNASGEIDDAGTWSINGNMLVHKSNGETETFSDEFSVSGNTLTIVNEEGGEPVIFTRA